MMTSRSWSLSFATLALIFSGLWLASPNAEGATLAQYTFPTAASGETGSAYSATTVEAGVNASAIADTSTNTVISTATGNYTFSPPVLKLAPTTAQASQSAALANGTFVSFSVTAVAGQFLDLTSLTFNVARGGEAGSTRGYAITSDVLGFDQVLAGGSPTGVQPTMDFVTVPLAADDYQNLPAITFRIYVYTGGSGNSVDFDNITLNGSVVPEPSKSALLVLAALFTGLRRRRNPSLT